MIGIDAGMVAAKMVKCQAGANRPNQDLISDSMGLVVAEAAIALGVSRASPGPAIA